MSDFILVDTGNDSVRLVHKETGRQYGEYFQEFIRTPECEAASIVYKKYKRKLGLEHKDFIELRDSIIKFSQDRMDNKVNKEYLIQIASSKIKEYENKLNENTGQDHIKSVE